MIGTLITPTSASTAPAPSAGRGSSIADCKEIKPTYRKSSISVEVIRASQTHHVPHVGLPQKAPVTKEINVNSAPVIASDEAIMEASRALKAQPIPA